MKLNNGDIFVAREPLAKLMEQKFPVMVSYKLVKMVSKLNANYVIRHMLQHTTKQIQGRHKQDKKDIANYIQKTLQLLEKGIV